MTIKLSSLRVAPDFDASKYVAGMQAKVAADEAGASSSRAVGQAVDQTDVKIGRSGNLLERLSRQYIDGYGAAQRFNVEVLKVARATDTADATLEHMQALLAGVHAKFGMTADAAALNELGFDRMAEAAAALNKQLQLQADVAARAASATRLAATSASGQSQWNDWAGIQAPRGDSDARAADIAAYGAELDALRAKYNPLFAAEQQHLTIVREISQAQKVGAISVDEMAAALTRQEAAYAKQIIAITGIDPAAQQAAKGTGLAAHEVTNLSYQINDMAMMLASGQSPFMLMMQQGTQVSQIMGPRGLGEIIPALGAGIASLVTPTTLFLAGITAAGYAGYAAFRMIQPQVKALDDIVAAHEANLERLSPAYAEIIEKTRELVTESEKLGNLRLRTDAIEAMARRIKDASDALKGGVLVAQGGLFSEDFTGAQKAIDAFVKSVKDGTPEVRAFQEQIAGLEAVGLISEGVAKQLIDATDAAAATERALAGVTGAVDPVAKAFSDMSTQIERIDRFDAGGRLGEIESAASDLMRRLQSGQITNEQFADSIQAIENANPDVGAIIAKIGSIAAAAAAGQAQVGAFSRMLAGMGGVAPKGDRVDTGGAMDRAQEQYDYLFTMSRRISDAFKEIDPDKPKKLREHIDRAANAYRDLIKNAQDRIDQMKLEEQLVGKSGVAADTLRFKLDLLQDATDKGRKIDEKKLATIGRLTEEYRRQATVLAEARALEELAFERSVIGLSNTDVRIAESLRDVGLDISSIEGQRIALAIRLTDELQRQQERYEDIAGIIGDTIGSALIDVFRGGITSFDEFMDHVSQGFAQLAENNIMALFDMGPNGILAGLGSGGGGAANDNDPWAGLREDITKGVSEGAAEGTLTGWGGVLKMMGASNSVAAAGGTAIGAGVGGFGMGYQSQSPIMGAIGGGMSGLSMGMGIAASGMLTGALAGSMVMPVIGTIVGAIAGALGGILGSNSADKKEKEAAQQQLAQQSAAVTQLLQVSRGQGVGTYQKQYQEASDANVKLQGLADKAGNRKLFSELQDASNSLFSILYDEFLGKFDGFNQALRDGLGKNSPFEQGRTTVMAMRDELKGWVADADFLSRESSRLGGGNISEAEIQRQVREAQDAAQSMALSVLTGARTLGAVEAEMMRIDGAAIALKDTLTQLGMSTEEADARIAEARTQAEERLRREFTAGVDARFYAANGQGYINELKSLAEQTKASLEDSARQGGLGMERIRETFRLSAQTIANDANLSADQVAEANLILAAALAEIGMSVPQAAQEAAEAITVAFDRAGLVAKINDASGRGYLNQFGGLRSERGALMGQASSIADFELIGQYSVAAARQIAESSGLTSEAIRGLATTFPEFGRTLLSVADDMDRAAETARNAEVAAQAAAAAAARRAAILGLQSGLLERTQGQAAAQDWQLGQLQVGNVGLSGIRSAGSIEDARGELEKFIATIKRTGQSADDISAAGQLAYSVFDGVVERLQAAGSESERLFEGLRDNSRSVIDALGQQSERWQSELQQAFSRGISELEQRRGSYLDAIGGVDQYLNSIAMQGTNPETEFNLMRQRYLEQAARARSGNPQDLEALTSLSSSFLQASSEWAPGGTREYYEQLQLVRESLTTARGAAQAEADRMGDRIASMQQQMSRDLASIKEATERQTESLGALMQAFVDRQGELLAGQTAGLTGVQMLLVEVRTALQDGADQSELRRLIDKLGREMQRLTDELPRRIAA